MKTGYMAVIDIDDIQTTISGDRFTLQLFNCLDGKDDLYLMFYMEAMEEFIEDYNRAKEIIFDRTGE